MERLSEKLYVNRFLGQCQCRLRWEARRMGIEDYELIAMYAKAKEDADAKALAKSVLDYPQDTAKADVVRRKILLELSR